MGESVEGELVAEQVQRLVQRSERVNQFACKNIKGGQSRQKSIYYSNKWQNFYEKGFVVLVVFGCLIERLGAAGGSGMFGQVS